MVAYSRKASFLIHAIIKKAASNILAEIQKQLHILDELLEIGRELKFLNKVRAAPRH